MLRTHLVSLKGTHALRASGATALLLGLLLSAAPAFADDDRDDEQGRDDDRRGRPTLFVDDDKVQCPNAAYTTIQAAVDAATPGARIRVCPGSYTSTVVNKSVSLDGAGPSPAARGATADPTREAVVNRTTGAGFDVTADDVRIRGFTIQSAAGAPEGVGIYLHREFSGSQVERNLIRGNTFGVYLNSSGARRTEVSKNLFVANTLAGSASGNGIYSDQGASNVRISDNRFNGHTNASIIFVGGATPAAAQTNLEIRHNEIVDDAPVILSRVSDSRIAGNLSVRSVGSAIFVGGGSSGLEIVGNRLRDGAFSGIVLTVDAANYSGDPNTNNRVEKNRASGFGDDGIAVREATSGTLVRNNRVEANRRDGIRLQNAVGNTIEQNRARNNGAGGTPPEAVDCYDNTAGTGTAGTGNTWQKNRGDTENRPGLCRPFEGADDDDEVADDRHADGDDRQEDRRDDDAADSSDDRGRGAAEQREDRSDDDRGPDDRGRGRDDEGRERGDD